MANHEPFNDHLMRDWELSGPERGVGSKARVHTRALGMSDVVDIEVIEAEAPTRIVERNTAAKAGRTGQGTYTLDPLPDGGTRITFEYRWIVAPMIDRLTAPVARAYIRRNNDDGNAPPRRATGRARFERTGRRPPARCGHGLLVAMDTAELEWIAWTTPITTALGIEVAAGDLSGRTVACRQHILADTICIVAPLIEAGASVRMAPCNPDSTDDRAAAHLASIGVEIRARAGMTVSRACRCARLGRERTG